MKTNIPQGSIAMCIKSSEILTNCFIAGFLQKYQQRENKNWSVFGKDTGESTVSSAHF